MQFRETSQGTVSRLENAYIIVCQSRLEAETCELAKQGPRARIRARKRWRCLESNENGDKHWRSRSYRRQRNPSREGDCFIYMSFAIGNDH